MKWIVLVILVYVVGYTFITISYRKPADTAHEPYAEARERSRRMVHASMNGWTRLACTFTENAPAFASVAPIQMLPLPEPLDRHLPTDLVLIMPGKPALHPARLTPSAAPTVPAAESLQVRLEFASGPAVPAFGETLAYYKDNHLYLFLQDKRHVAPDTQPTPATSPLALVLPAATLTAGTWQASVFTASQAFTWSFTVE